MTNILILAAILATGMLLGLLMITILENY